MRSRSAADRGSVTAEFAVALPAVVLVLVFCLALAAGGVSQLRAADAARAGARAVAIGSSTAEVVAIVTHLAGPAARVVVVERELVTVHVAVPLPVLARWGTFEARAEAVALPEPGAP